MHVRLGCDAPLVPSCPCVGTYRGARCSVSRHCCLRQGKVLRLDLETVPTLT